MITKRQIVVKMLVERESWLWSDSEELSELDSVRGKFAWRRALVS